MIASIDSLESKLRFEFVSGRGITINWGSQLDRDKSGELIFRQWKKHVMQVGVTKDKETH